ncbi:unnamed protein product [Rotaria magnacalcarata]|uniref:Uncharacterized protein n=2 Tax=Rotaria magnacalcarata TaxID=392030 RepID=A0A816Z497_9BILA|nr:unnamed protein product [Rotaria magnacalcarata]
MSSSDYNRYASSNQGKRRIKLIVVEFWLFLLLYLLLFSLFFGKKVIQRNTFNAVNLKPDSDCFKKWYNPPINNIGSCHLFNITNPIEIVNDPTSIAINLKETRAYSYSLSATKQDIQWSDDNKSISYSIHRLFTHHPTRFDPSSVHDTGVFIDLVRAIFRTSFGHKPSQAFYALAGMNTFYRRNAVEQLEVHDTGVFIDLVRAIFRTSFGHKPSQAFYALAGMNTFYHRNAVEQLEGFNSDLFETVREKMTGPNTAKSGFIYRYNGSQLYNISIYIDPDKKGQIVEFNSESVRFNISSSSHYTFPVNNGLTFPTMLFDKPEIYIFNAEFCRPILIQYTKNVSSFGGIKMREDKIKLIDFDHFKNFKNGKSYMEVDKIGISKCISESAPHNTIFLSKAHFYGSSSETIHRTNINGFKPESGNHDSYIYFELYSGTPLKAVYRMQLNIEAIIDPMKQSKNGSGFTSVERKGATRLIPII